MCVSVGGVSAVHSVWETGVHVCVCVCFPVLANQHTPGGVPGAAHAHLTSFISFCW